MAAFTLFQFAKWLAQRPERASAFGLQIDVPPSRGGRPPISPALKQSLVEQVELKRDRRALEGGSGYGDSCGDADAIRCEMRDLYHARLMAEGQTREEADRLVTEYADTPEFEGKLRSHKVRFSRRPHFR